MFLLLLNLDILARMHGKEEGNDGELRDCTLELRQFFGNFGNDAWGDGILLMFLWVGIFVGLVLALQNEAKLKVVVLGWIGLAFFPEGHRYIQDSISDCSQS